MPIITRFFNAWAFRSFVSFKVIKLACKFSEGFQFLLKPLRAVRQNLQSMVATGLSGYADRPVIFFGNQNAFDKKTSSRRRRSFFCFHLWIPGFDDFGRLIAGNFLEI